MNREISKLEAVFIDRDGTIGGTGHFIHPQDFTPYRFSMEALNILYSKGIKVFAFTNQHRISRGDVKIEDFKNEFSEMGFTDSYICPHPLNSDCACQKPKPGLLLKAAKEYNLNLENCVVIGDVGTDMLAAEAVGAKKVIVRTGWGEGSLGEYRYIWENVHPEYIAENLLDAVKWIVEKLIGK